jgi:hypothetical protein
LQLSSTQPEPRLTIAAEPQRTDKPDATAAASPGGTPRKVFAVARPNLDIDSADCAVIITALLHFAGSPPAYADKATIEHAARVADRMEAFDAAARRAAGKPPRPGF